MLETTQLFVRQYKICCKPHLPCWWRLNNWDQIHYIAYYILQHCEMEIQLQILLSAQYYTQLTILRNHFNS